MKYPSQIRAHNFCSNGCREKWLPNIPGRIEAVIKANKRRSKPKVERVCKWCGKVFHVLPSLMGRTDMKHADCGSFCSAKCRDSGHSNYMKNHPETHAQMRTTEAFMKLSQAQTGKHYSDATNKKKGRPGMLNPFYRHKHSRETRELIGRLASARMSNPIERQRIIEAIFAANRRRPNKAELRLERILMEHFPGEWRYTGDGYHIIGGYVPDFSNANGAKTVIELFGRFWHTRPNVPEHYTEVGRIQAYSSLGYRCLVIWDNELKDERAVVAKVKQFMRRSK